MGEPEEGFRGEGEECEGDECGGAGQVAGGEFEAIGEEEDAERAAERCGGDEAQGEIESE